MSQKKLHKISSYPPPAGDRGWTFSLLGKSYLPLILLFIPLLTFSQPSQVVINRLRAPDPSGGMVVVTQEDKISELLNFHLTQQRALNGVMGYRISIYLGMGQNASKNADNVKANFIGKYDDVECYKMFEYPYYKIYVGDFRTKSEALRFQQKIIKDYPDAYIREDVIALSE